MSAHILLNLLYKLRKRDEMHGLTGTLSLFRNKFNKFNNTEARMLDSIYYMTLKYLKIAFWRENVKISPHLPKTKVLPSIPNVK